MSVLRHLLRPGSYLDSVVSMRLQVALVALPGVEEAAAMMATAGNRAVLEASGLWPAGADDVDGARSDDLLIVVRAESAAAAETALGRIDELLAERRDRVAGAYRYKSLAAALTDRPQASWVAVSVPGAHAAAVADEALAAGRHVFVYSDNVALDDEVRLKRRAAAAGLLLLGPDCGTAAVGGVGLGFCNRLERGAVGLVGASGTGLQTLACGIDARGGGVSHLLGSGGRDLDARVGGAATLRAIDLLDRDPDTRVIAVVSKPPAPEVAARVLGRLRRLRTPSVVCLVGAPGIPSLGRVHVAGGLDHAAELAVELAAGRPAAGETEPPSGEATPGEAAGGETGGGYLRGLFSGGTLALETALALAPWLHPLSTNLGLPATRPLADPRRSVGHTVVDLGADQLTAGRPHPMLEPAERDRRLVAEAADPEVATILVDVVLGDGAHPDPAAGLGPAIEDALAAAAGAGRRLAIVTLVVGTRRDPQDLEAQCARLAAAGATVVRSVADAVRYAAANAATEPPPTDSAPPPVPLSALAPPTVINVGLAAFAAAVADQGGEAVQVDWRPPAGGDERLAGILARMKGGATKGDG